jgi:hypothetical protein
VVHDDELEALPVVIDGIERAPERADVSPFAMTTVASAVRDTAAEAPIVRAQRPWAAGAAAPVARSAHFLAAFTRMTEVHPAQLDALPAWWANAAHDDRVEIARRLVLEAPHRDATGGWRVRGRLRSPWRARSIPVELLLWPRLGAWTKLAVEPQRDVHVGRRYFRSGHRVLDALTERLKRELPLR